MPSEVKSDPGAAKHQKPISKNHKYPFLALIIVLYLIIAFTYSLLTPAQEANDEYDHTLYVEYIVDHHSIPRINIANGDESHQPPLYYISAALWQNLLQIPHFALKRLSPNLTPHLPTKPYLGLAHNYTKAERKDAIYLHELRILSILFGVGTIVFTFWATETIAKRLSVSLAATSFVALLPKEIVVTSVVTNDSLVIMLCSLALALTLKWFNCHSQRQRMVIIGALGLVLGAAAITKFNSLPLIILDLIIVIVPSIKSKSWREPLIVITTFLLTSGWWFYHNLTQYGDVLASKASNYYLSKAIPNLIHPLPFNLMLRYLVQSAWYDGGGNQLLLSIWVNIALAILATISLIGASLYFMKISRKNYCPRSHKKNKTLSSILLLSVASGFIALLIVARDTTQAEGRVTYIGLSAFAICLTIGAAFLLQKISIYFKYIGLWMWPVIFGILNTYIIAHIVYPLRGL
jgi:hypothetical protein